MRTEFSVRRIIGPHFALQKIHIFAMAKIVQFKIYIFPIFTFYAKNAIKVRFFITKSLN